MTDIERFKETLQSLSIPFEQVDKISEKDVISQIANIDYARKIIVGEGLGYGLFYVDFYFDADGKFLNWGVWE